MERFRHAHLWLLIPFAIAILGFVPSYWLRFADAPWRQHLHGLTATAWFVVLILQPWFATRGHLKRHRLFGMCALFLAGGVVISGLGAIPYNLLNEGLPPAAQYGLSFVDVVLISGFTWAVFMAVRTARSVDDHGRWMVSTVFWSVFPGLFRLSFVPLGMIYGDDVPFMPSQILAAMGVISVGVLGILMVRDRRAHPAYVLAVLGSIVYFIAIPVGSSGWWQAVADALFKI